MPAPKTANIYHWEDMPQDQPLELLARRRIIGSEAMLSEVFLQRGCHVPTHAHENEQFACVISGELRFGIGPEGSDERYEVTVGPGDVLHLPANVQHSADALEDSLVLDIFAPPSEVTGVDRP